MKLMKSTPITKGISFSAGYTHNCSIMIVHAKPPKVPLTEKLHYHTKDSEYFLVLKGELKVEVDKQHISIKKGECLETQPLEKHRILDFIEGTEYIVVRTNTLPGEKVTVE